MSAPAPPIRVWHWRELPLDAGGRSLVEASAGTGKTWTIGVLYLRLLLESSPALRVEQIVVTTFTDAAAQELRERLRTRLTTTAAAAAAAPPAVGAPSGAMSKGIAAEAAPTGEQKADDVAWLHARWADEPTRREDLRRLRLALADFDRAPIGTLHGVCRRILAEHPLEGGGDFEPGAPTSGEALLDELARDAWRVLHQGDGDDGDPFEAAGIARPSLHQFTRTLREVLRPGVRIDADGELLDDLRADTPADFAGRVHALLADRALFQSRKTALANALRGFADFLCGDDAALKDSAPEHLRRFDVADQIAPARQQAFIAEPLIVELRARFARYEAALCRPRLRFWKAQQEQAERWRGERLAARGQTTFDEMVRQAHAAIVARPLLADALFADWPVALVDEFQDTDALQYGILDRVYREADGSKRGRLVMIGDPKQAIYGFRGGDPLAYRRARSHADHALTLATNHRSSRACVDAVNAFFEHAGPALGRSPGCDIVVEPVLASGRADATPLTIDGVAVTRPLVLHHQTDDPGSAPARRRAALTACARQIATMLADGRHALGGVPLAPGDIAVLLPRNSDIVALRALLQARGVPCVGGARDSVFAGDWAFELHVVLQALLADDDDGALRAAMLTGLWGAGIAEVAALDQDAAAWQAAAERRRELRATWQRRGVLAVVMQLAEAAAGRLLAGPSGERDLTDLRHLGELLQQHAAEVAGPRELLAWFAAQRDGDGGDDDAADERQLRIESDARRVQLLTLHKSKGLEFPIVFLPLSWAHEAQRASPPWLVAHDDEPGRRLSYAPDDHARACRDGQDERFRTLYVALTRAVHACHVYTLPPDRPANARAKSPKVDPDRSPLDAMVQTLLTVERARLPCIEWRDGWPRDEARLAADPSLTAPRRARVLPPPPPPRMRLSFSALVGAARAGVEEAPADDEALAAEVIVATAMPAPDAIAPDPLAPAAEEPHPALLALAGSRGTAFGNALHAVFEDRAFDRPLREQAGMIAGALAKAGVAATMPLPELAARLGERLDGALAAELAPGLRLGEVPAAAQRAEMSFHFPLDDVRVDALRAACARHGEPDLLPPLSLSRLRGLMTGAIDLVFEHADRWYVLDYKGNWLGERLSDYQGAALRATMDHAHYRLQALVYTVALRRLLRQRLPGFDPARHLGGYVYLFVRAAGLAPGAGVFAERFEDALVAAVDAAFAARVEEPA